VGRVNNVDVRQDVLRTDGSRLDIAAASHRVKIGITVCEITPAGQLIELPGSPVPVSVTEPYGFCLAKDASGSLLGAVNDKNGRVEVWQLLITADGVRRGRLVRELKLNSQVEGMVADDDSGWLFIGEEVAGVWRLDLSSGELLSFAKTNPSGPLVPDVEGLAIAQTSRGKVLFCSSQGNSSFVAYQTEPPFQIVGVLRIGSGTVGSVEETDGIDICTTGLGPVYPNGVFVVQDGVNTPFNQNFKIVRWDVLCEAMGL
jgi:3-phytase